MMVMGRITFGNVTTDGGWVCRDTPSRSCNCVGPQNGQPLCPCQMHGVEVRNGRYVKVTDLGPVPGDPDQARLDWYFD